MTSKHCNINLYLQIYKVYWYLNHENEVKLHLISDC